MFTFVATVQVQWRPHAAPQFCVTTSINASLYVVMCADSLECEKDFSPPKTRTVAYFELCVGATRRATDTMRIEDTDEEKKTDGHLARGVIHMCGFIHMDSVPS